MQNIDADDNRTSFLEFDRRARAGDDLSVVFFGGSLTWGANSTDPQLNSYRPRLAGRLQAAYPDAHWTFWDAAIGGTGSQLGVFRLERDVLSRNPDLVFLDFTVNDDLFSVDDERLASYEAIVRTLIDAGILVVLVFFPNKDAARLPSPEPVLRRTAHLKVAEAYGAGVGDVVAFFQHKIQTGAASADVLWSDPNDSTHPTDAGYALYAEAVWSGLLDAISKERLCKSPGRMLYANTYMHSARTRLTSIVRGASGWRSERPNRISAYYDMLMSRWLDGELVASRADVDSPDPASLSFKFHGSMALLFAESTPTSGHYLVILDGARSREIYDAGAIGRPSRGNAHHVQILAQGLDPAIEHSLTLVPELQPGEELRFESICVAGGASPKVTFTPAR